MVQSGADYCDIREERWDRTVVVLRDGAVETVTHGEEEGAMLRVLYKTGWGYLGTSNLDSIDRAARRAFSMAKSNSRYKKEETGLSEIEILQEEKNIPMKQNICDVSPGEKISFLQEVDTMLREDFVRSIELQYTDSLVEKEISSSEGTHIKMRIPRVTIYITVTGRSDTVQRAVEGIGGTGGYEVTERVYSKTDMVTARLKSLLKAAPPPRGNLPLIMDPHLTGIFIHEAFGHAAEGDVVTSNNSCLAGKLGESVAAEPVTISDDPTFHGYGQTPFDDEGTRAQPRILVKEGVFNDYIVDRENGWMLGRASNGGARAEDFRVKPLVRMSNTMLHPGTLTVEELLEEVDNGVYAQSSSGGEVNPAQGTFQFNAQVAYKIEKGEITRPLRGVSFSGATLTTLQNITGIAHDFEMGINQCGKGQRVPVSSGGPHVLISAVAVGGRA
jgi:TldD protein